MQILPLVVEAGYRFEILLVGYQNPWHISIYGDYCEGSDQRNNPCDNAFTICIHQRGAPDNECDIGRFETTLIRRDSDNLIFTEGESIGGVLNPITVTGDTWPVSYLQGGHYIQSIPGHPVHGLSTLKHCQLLRALHTWHTTIASLFGFQTSAICLEGSV